MMIKHLLTLYDSHYYLVTDDLTGFCAPVESSLAPHILDFAPELFSDAIDQGVAKCREKWKAINTPTLVLTMQNTVTRKGVINDRGELCID